jgi:nodulation protein F
MPMEGDFMETVWDEDFERILRGYLPFLENDEALESDTDLKDVGLDSLGTVELLGTLEEHYQVRFVDDDLSRETFASPRVLWATLRRMSATAA